MANEFSGIPAVDNPFSPDVFADEAVGFENINGTFRITFGAIKMADPVPPSSNQMVVVGRLILPIRGAQTLALGLFDYLKQQGHDPTTLLSGGQDEKPH
jgi:hypothetical protein